MGRDTTTGSNYESIIELCIKRSCDKHNLRAVDQAFVGEKPGGGRHKIDWEIIDVANENRRALVSCKVQNKSGTAEEKIAYEVIKLLHAMEHDPRYLHSWILMGGDGWSAGMKSFVENELEKWVPAMRDRVTIISSTDALISSDIFAALASGS